MGVALASGLAAGGALVAVLALRTGAKLELRGAQIQRAAEGQGTGVEALLGVQGSQMAKRLETYAQIAAQKHLADVYGVTPARVARLQALGARLGV